MDNSKDFWRSRINKWTALDPPDRIAEGLFGLIMVLTFTCTISVTSAGRQEVEELLWAALGCNLAWGIVDGIMYLMDELVNRAHGIKLLSQIRQSESLSESRALLRDSINPVVSELMEDDEIDRLSGKIKKLPELPVRNALVLKNFIVAGQIFLIVFSITFPVALPFLLITEVPLAMRVSNGIAVVMLFAGGYALARYSGLKPVLTGLSYTAIGVFLVIMTMALGG